MKALIACLLGACLLRAESPPRIPAPLYTPSSIVNAASFKGGPLAPNTIGTLYGRDLAFLTRSLAAEDIYNGTLPTTLLGTGVRLLIKNTVAFIYFVSPTQVNFLVPSTLTPGPADLLFSLDGRYGEAAESRSRNSRRRFSNSTRRRSSPRIPMAVSSMAKSRRSQGTS